MIGINDVLKLLTAIQVKQQTLKHTAKFVYYDLMTNYSFSPKFKRMIPKYKLEVYTKEKIEVVDENGEIKNKLQKVAIRTLIGNPASMVVYLAEEVKKYDR